jgi:Spo0E like sporulation regulatory protein
MMLVSIEDYLRNKMIQTAQVKGILSDPEVVKVSQQLDNFLTQTQHVMQEQWFHLLQASIK